MLGQQGQTEVTSSTIKPIYDKLQFRKNYLHVLNQIVRNRTGKNLVLNDENKRVINLICQYLNNEPEFLEQGYSFDKGLWLTGKFGTGKTVIMLAYREMKRLVFSKKVGFKTCVEMNDYFTSLNEYTNKIEGLNGIKTFANRLDQVERIFDDLGEEEIQVNDYGNKTCVMQKILSERYKGYPLVKTHITTNLSRKEIEEDYGGRLESRIYEMFNFIPLGVKDDYQDFRKLK